jgi:transcriptional regulator of acetoin/glycerol metabolism
MHDELAQIRERNMAMDREENELGVSCLAVPVFDIHGRVPYAISISLSTSRLKQVGEKNLLAAARYGRGDFPRTGLFRAGRVRQMTKLSRASERKRR